jgi:hypothetical protein
MNKQKDKMTSSDGPKFVVSKKSIAFLEQENKSFLCSCNGSMPRIEVNTMIEDFTQTKLGGYKW